MLTYTETTDVELSEIVTTTPTNTISIAHTTRLPTIVRNTTAASCSGVLSKVRHCATIFVMTMLSAWRRTMDRRDAKNTQSILLRIRSYTSITCTLTQNNKSNMFWFYALHCFI